MRVLIVDDERSARIRLRRLLSAVAEVEIIGEAASAREAMLLANSQAPDLVLMDVQMPESSGIDAALSWPDPKPAIVFVSAFGQHAVSAFDVEAVDYLLKPVEGERLARSLARARRRCSTSSSLPRKSGKQLLIPDRGRIHVMPLPEIVWLEAADNYVLVHGIGRAPLLRRTLSALLEDIGSDFVRIHRGAAVALAHVIQVRPLRSGDATVIVAGGEEVRCSRQYRAALEFALRALY